MGDPLIAAPISLSPLGSAPAINEYVTDPTLDVADRLISTVILSVSKPKLPAGVIHVIM